MARANIYKTVRKNALEEDVFRLIPSRVFWKPSSWEYLRTQLIDRTDRKIKGIDDYTWDAFKRYCLTNNLKQGAAFAKLVESGMADREWADGSASETIERKNELAMAAGHSLFYVGEKRVSMVEAQQECARRRYADTDGETVERLDG
ncbi:hypothetical protein ACL02T_34510 [Pseudonocardia sp. RS010]|uniref:hypothetical protein n=1 Tax=Pseudonocardia sp. RS010 TaxID=3385979 RepID=UPI0039A17AB1